MGFSRLSVGLLCFASAGLWANPAHAECSSATALAKLNDYGIAVVLPNPSLNRLANLPEDFSGLIVSTVDPSSDAYQQGLVRGEGIVSINSFAVSDITQASALLCYGLGQSISLQTQSGAGGTWYRRVSKRAKSEDTTWLTPIPAAPGPSMQSEGSNHDVAISDSIEAAKRKCALLGYAPGTMKFGQCVLKLSE